MPDEDLLPLLQERLLATESPLLTDQHASLLFTSGDSANWTVDVDDGRASAVRGRPTRPTTTIRASLPVLTEVVAGRRSGVQAFLDGTLTVRGNLALALQLDGMFPGDDADVTRTRTRSVDAGGLATFFLESGPVDAPPVVLVHGLSSTNASMLPLIPALSANYHVLAPDLPGHGGTQASGASQAARYLGDWLAEFVSQTCQGPAVLIGNSLGGRTCLETALNSPDLVRGLVLLCPAVALRKRQLVPFVRLVPDEIAALPVRFPRALARSGLRNLFADPSIVPASWYDAAMDEFLRMIAIRANRLAIFSALRHIYLDRPFGGQGFWDRLPGLQPPALFIWGERDTLVPARFARFVDEALPSATTVVLDGCGHVPQFERKERTIELTRDFLDRLPARATDA